jgi:hypothetical protein
LVVLIALVMVVPFRYHLMTSSHKKTDRLSSNRETVRSDRDYYNLSVSNLFPIERSHLYNVEPSDPESPYYTPPNRADTNSH